MSINKIFFIIIVLLPNFTLSMQDSQIREATISLPVIPLSTFEYGQHCRDSFPQPGDSFGDHYEVEYYSFFLLLAEAQRQVCESNKEPFNELIEKIRSKQLNIERTNYFSTIKVTAKDAYYRLLPYIWWVNDKRYSSRGKEFTVLIDKKLAILRITSAKTNTWKLALDNFSSFKEISEIREQEYKKQIAHLLNTKAAL